jgi:hypothetical protein
MLHLREHSRMSAGGADWLIQNGTAWILARHGIPLDLANLGDFKERVGAGAPGRRTRTQSSA